MTLFKVFILSALKFFDAVNCHGIITLDLNSNIGFNCLMNSSF